MKILITGFEPFNGMEVNPSKTIAKKYVRSNYIVCILPVSYQKAKEEFLKVIEKEKPDYILSLGLNSGSQSVRVEHYAYNLMSGKNPDEDGVYKNQEVIIPGAPSRFSSLVDTTLITTLCKLKGISCIESGDPGRFICNMIYYLALNSKAKASLFIHLPKFEDMSSDQMVLAVDVAIEVLINGRHNPNNI